MTEASRISGRGRQVRLDALIHEVDSESAKVVTELLDLKAGLNAQAAAFSASVGMRAARLRMLTRFGGAAYMVVVVWVWWWASTRIVRPLQILSEAADGIGQPGQPLVVALRRARSRLAI